MSWFDFRNTKDVFVGSTLAKAVYLGLKKIWDAITAPEYTAPTAKTGLVYSGSAQALLNAGSTNHGTIQYSTDNTNWSTSVPTSTNANTNITVYWKLVGDSRHSSISSTAITCSIAKASPTYTAPSAKILTYNGEEQALLNAGSTSHGTIQYSSDNSNWSTTVPTGTNATSYTRYWRLVGDSNHDSVSSQSISITISKVTPTVTAPTAKVLTYNTSAQALVNAGSTNFGTLQYSLDGTNWSTSVPTATNYGSYTVYYKVVGNDNINSVAAETVSCSIAEKRVSSPTITLSPASYTYSGNNCEPTVVVKDGDNVIPTSEYTVTYSNNKNAGTATVTISDNTNGNYNVTGSKTFEIAKVTPTVTAPTAKTLTYSGNSQQLANAGSTNWGTMQYSADGTTWGSDIPSGTNASTSYKVYYRVVGNSNVNDVAATYITCSIAKANPTYTAPTDKSLTYNGNAQTLLNAGSTSHGTIQYSSDNSNWSTNIPTATTATSHDTYWRLVGDSNHNDVASTKITVTIAKVTPTVTAPTAKTGLVYSGSAQTLANAGSTNYGTLKYSLNNSDWSDSVPTGTNANGYTLYYKVVGNSNVNDVAAASISCSIGKANPTYTAPTAKTLTYTGSAQELLNAGSTNHGAIKYSSNGTDWSTSVPKSTNASTSITVYWKLDGDSNHNNVSSTSIVCSIAKANLSASVSMSGWTYGSTATNPSVSGNSGSGAVTYTYKVSGAADSTYSSTKPSNAGNYVVRAVIAETSNYNGATVTGTFTIAKANLSASVSMSGWTYGGTASTPSVTGNSGSGTVTYSYKASGAADSTYTTTKPSNAGDYVVRAVIAETSNYNGKTVTSTFTIAKATPSYTAPTKKTLTYNGSDQTLLNAGSTSHGTIKYSSDNSTWSTNIPTGKTVADYDVYWKLEGDSNHNSVSSTKITVSISKVTPTVTAPTAKVLTYNKSKQALVNAGSTNFGTLQYSLDNSTWGTSIPKATNQGSYTVYYKVVGDSNINDVAASSVACSISEKSVTATVTLSQTEYTYNGTQCRPSVTVKDGTDVIPSTEYTVTYSNNTDAGTATVTITDNTGGNYNVIGSAEFTINKANLSASVSLSGWTYGGTANNPSVSGNSGGGSVTYSYKVSTAADSTYSSTKPSNAGTYTVKAVIAATSNYNSATVTNTFTISKADPTIVAPTKKTLTYTGSAQALVNAGTNTTAGSFKYAIGTATQTATIPTATNADTSGYTVNWTFTPTDTTNYNTKTGSVTVPIARANISPTITMANWTYGSTASTPSVSGNSGNGSVTYTYKVSTAADSTYTSTKPSNAGTYTIKAVIAQTTNYNSATVTKNFTINQLVVHTAPVANGQTYSGSAITLLKNGSANNKGTLEYSANGTSGWSTTCPSKTNAGTYNTWWRFTPTDTTNHVTVGATRISTTIAQANGVAGVSGRTLTFSGSAQNLVTVSGNTGTVHYRLGTSGSWSTTIPTATNASSSNYTVYYYVDASTNYKAVASKSSPNSVNTTIGKASISPSITMANWTYGGTASNPSVSGNSGSGSVTYTYKVSTAADSTYSSTKPSNAGTYTIKAVVAETDNYFGATVTKNFTISKANLSASVSLTGWTYGGTANSPSVSGNSGNGNVTYSYKVNGAADSTYTSTKPGSTSTAQTYVVRAVIAETSNYNGKTVTSTFTIAKATGVAGVSGRSLTFNGSAQNLVTVSGNTGTVYYRLGTNGTWSTTIPTATNASDSNYVVYYYVDASTNYNAVASQSSPNSVNTTIAKANISASVSMSNWTYGGTASNPSVSGNSGSGSVTYTYKVSTAADSTYTSTKPSTAGTYTVKAVIAATSNYNGATVTSNFTIAKADPTIVAPTKKTLTYNGSAQSLVNAGTNTTAGSFKYAIGTATQTATIPTATNANTSGYTVNWTFTPTDTTNYKTVTGSVNVPIAKANPNIYPQTLTYNRGAQTLVSKTGDGTFYWRIGTSGSFSTTLPSATNVATYTVQFYVTEGTNYKAIGSSSSPSQIFPKINRATPVINANPTAVSGWTYDGSAHNLLQGGSVKHSSTDSTSVAGTFTYSKKTDAGTYTSAVWSFEPNDDTNYTGISGNITGISVVVSKADPTYSAPTKKTGLVYSGSAQALANAGTNTTAGAFTYALGTGSYGSAIPTATNANESGYTVNWKFTPTDTTNYNTKTGSLTVTIAKKDPTITAPTAKSGLSYTGSSQTLYNAGNNTTAGSFSYSNGTRTNAGSQTVSWSFKPTDTTNYNSKSGSFNVSIAKIDPTITAPTAKSNLTYSGSSQTLYNAGSNTTAGSFSYSNGTRTNAGSQTVSWSFKPTDTTNYNSKSGSFTGSIAKASAVVSGRSLTYNRGSQTLVSVTGDGTFHYKVGSGSWSTTAPTATNAATYTIYWYMGEGTNYKATNSSSSAGSVSTTIAKVRPVVATLPSAVSDWTYDGSAHNLLSGGAMKHSSSDSTAVAGTFTYQKVTNAGTYSSATYDFTPTDTTNYNGFGGVVSNIDVVVLKATGSANVSGRTVTYSRGAQDMVSVSNATGTMYYRVGTRGSWLTTIPKRTNAGSDTIYYYMAASTNYTSRGSSGSPWGSVTGTVNKCTPVLSTSPTYRTGLSYTGSAQNLLTGGAMKHSSSNSTAVAGTFTYDQGTNAGTYSSKKWYFTPTDSTDYNSTNGTVSGSATIGKASVNTGTVNSPSVTFSTSSQTVSVSVSGASGTVTYPTSITVKNSGGTTLSGWSCTSAGVLTIPANIGSGTYTITGTVSVAASTNYNSGSASKTWTLTVNAKSISIPTPTNASKVYDATAATGTFGACTGATITKYRYSTNGSSWTESTTNPSQTAKGTLYTQAYYTASTNYTGSGWSSSATISISARPINITAASSSRAYNGLALTNNSATAEATGTNRGLVSGHSMTSCTVTGTITNVGSANNVPSSAVIKSGSTDVTSNYSITYVNGTLTVSKATLHIALLANDRAYNGNALYALATLDCPIYGVAPKGTIYYGTSSGATTYSVAYNSSEVNLSSVSQTNAGSKTVYAYFVPDSTCNAYYNNSANGSCTFTVSRASRTLSFTTAPSTVIKGNTITVAATPSAGSGDGTITFSSNNTSVATVNGSTITGVSDGSVTITASISQGTNYVAASTNYTLTVEANYDSRYLTFTATESGTFKFSREGVSYSTNNGSTWTALASNTDSPTISAGSKILWRALLTPSSSGIGRFSSTGRFTVEGNPMSLLYGDNFIGQTSLSGKTYAFRELFKGCTGMTSAENLVLPATTLATYCYYYMFQGCTSLTTAPSLPATTLTNYCYEYMFRGCTSLTTAPSLPATTLAEGCYYYMFRDCTSLTTAPSLPATTLAAGCYRCMFYGCTSLTTAPSLSATTLAANCYYGMFQGCTSLTTAPSLPATTLAASCYQSMFQGCTSLTTAPSLPAITLVDGCYVYMFKGCTSLNYIKAMFGIAPDVTQTRQWVKGVASSGTFVKNIDATWNVSGVDGIPSGWTVQTAPS